MVGDVRITNTADSPIPTEINEPVPVASSPHDPVVTKVTLPVVAILQKQVTITLTPNQRSGAASFVLPAAKLLYIESVSGFAITGPVPPGASPLVGNNAPFVSYNTTANGDQGDHLVSHEWVGNGWHLSGGSGCPLAYADPGSTVNVRFARNFPAGTGTMTLTFTGHFIDQ